MGRHNVRKGGEKEGGTARESPRIKGGGKENQPSFLTGGTSTEKGEKAQLPSRKSLVRVPRGGYSGVTQSCQKRERSGDQLSLEGGTEGDIAF